MHTIFTLLFGCFCLIAGAQAQQPATIVLHHESGQAAITDVSRQALQQWLQHFRNTSVRQVSIHAHTDPVGTGEDNRRLSQQRSEAVEAILRNQLTADSWVIRYSGEDSLLFTQPAQNAMNRRTEVVIWYEANTI